VNEHAEEEEEEVVEEEEGHTGIEIITNHLLRRSMLTMVEEF